MLENLEGETRLMIRECGGGGDCAPLSIAYGIRKDLKKHGSSERVTQNIVREWLVNVVTRDTRTLARFLAEYELGGQWEAYDEKAKPPPITDVDAIKKHLLSSKYWFDQNALRWLSCAPFFQRNQLRLITVKTLEDEDLSIQRVTTVDDDYQPDIREESGTYPSMFCSLARSRVL